jgi:hypothetical protein
VDEAHFRADVELRAKWVLRGELVLADSSSPELGEKVTYCSAVCLETGEEVTHELPLLWFRFCGRLKVGDGSPSRVQMAGPSDGLQAAGLAAGNQE